MKKAKTIFEKLKTDVNSVIFTEEETNNKLYEKLKLLYSEDKKLVSLISTLENFDDLKMKEPKTLPLRLD